MKILFCVHIYLPEHRAGVELYTAQLASHLGAQAEVAVVTTKKVISRVTGHVSQRMESGVPLWEVVNNLCHDSVEDTWNNPAMEEAFASILREFRPDVVHFQHLMYWSVGLPRLAKEAGCRTYLTLHDFWLMCSRMGQLVAPNGQLCQSPELHKCASCLEVTPFGQPEKAKIWISRLIRLRKFTGIALDEPMRWAAAKKGSGVSSQPPTKWQETKATAKSLEYVGQRQAAFQSLVQYLDLIITPSQDLMERFINWGMDSNKFRHLPQGRDHAAFAKSKPRQFCGRTHFVFVGTIAPHKGIRELVEAAKNLAGGNWSLDIYGPYAKQMAYWQEVKACAESQDNITLHGPVAPEDLPAVFAKADVFCIPSLWNECCPLTIQEAFMAHVPVIASDLGGMKELVQDGVGGLRAEAGNVEDWTRVMQSVIDSPSLLEQLKETVPAVPEIEDHIEELRRIYG